MLLLAFNKTKEKTFTGRKISAPSHNDTESRPYYAKCVHTKISKVTQVQTCILRRKTHSYKSGYEHYFWVSEPNKPREHSVKRIHLNGQERSSVMGRKSTQGVRAGDGGL